ncbi:MAG: response regulator [Desulfobacterales bacterium]|nr:response regulator [Desulfobacterales bacterium]
MAQGYHSKVVVQRDIQKDSVPFVSSGLPSQDEMYAVLTQSPVGICIIKKRGIIHWANPACYNMTGHEVGSLEGQSISSLYPTSKEYERIDRLLVDKLKRDGKAVTDTRLSRSDGTAFDCRVRASRLDPHDPAKGMLLTVSDITEIKSGQIRKQQAHKMEAIGTLAGGISHDFNNLLMGVQGHLSLMRINVNEPEKIGHHISQMTRLVETAAELTGRLLGFARGGKYQITALDINQLIGMALNIFQPDRKDLAIRENLAPELFAVNGDHSQLEQVLLNLMVNASQAMVDAGTLTIETRNVFVEQVHNYHFEIKPGPYVEILIKDTGIGMDEATQKKIFDPFFSTKEPGDKKGRGLGLSTVFGIVKNHGGFITVESKKGEGAIFRVCLPGSDEILDTDGLENGVGLDQMPKGNETVLIVDDEEEVLRLGRDFLEKLGYEALLARNGLEAIETFRSLKGEISLVVLDLIMPIMDGKETFNQIRNLDPSIKVLVSTGYNVDEEVETLLNKGCHGFLQKPFSMDKFSRVIREIIDRPPC